MLARVQRLPAGNWQHCQITQAKGKRRQVQYVEEWVQLVCYDGAVRQLIVTGLGHASPTFFLTNDQPEAQTARDVIQTYASRNHVENHLGEQITFFHLDCLCSEVRLNVDFDLTSEQEQIRKLARDFCDAEVAHTAEHHVVVTRGQDRLDVAVDPHDRPGQQRVAGGCVVSAVHREAVVLLAGKGAADVLLLRAELAASALGRTWERDSRRHTAPITDERTDRHENTAIHPPGTAAGRVQ
jgi:hypothetical protein